jgi:hypothetical protein
MMLSIVLFSQTTQPLMVNVGRFHRDMTVDREWVKTPLYQNDLSGRTELEAVKAKWVGHRHDVKLLIEYQKAYDARPSFKTAFAECAAVLGFGGFWTGHNLTYWQQNPPQMYLGEREYLHLIKHWASNNSAAYFEVRTVLFCYLGCDINLRVPALKRLAVFDPNNQKFATMEIFARNLQQSMYGPKLKVDNLKKDFAKAEGFLAKNYNQRNVGSCYGTIGYLYGETKDKKYLQMSTNYAKKLIELYKADVYDSKMIPDIQDQIKRNDERLKVTK